MISGFKKFLKKCVIFSFVFLFGPHLKSHITHYTSHMTPSWEPYSLLILSSHYISVIITSRLPECQGKPIQSLEECLVSAMFFNPNLGLKLPSLREGSLKNPAFGRHRISRPMRIETQIFFVKKKNQCRTTPCF